MASTSIHFPKGLLERLDELAREQGTSRNRLVVQACEQMIERRQRAWPEELLSNDHLSAQELVELRAAGTEMLDAIMSSRVSKTTAPF